MREQHPSVQLHRVRPDDWVSHRDLRLEALRDAPDAFWFTYADEVAFEGGLKLVVPPGELTCSRRTVGCSPVSRSIVAAP